MQKLIGRFSASQNIYTCVRPYVYCVSGGVRVLRGCVRVNGNNANMRQEHWCSVLDYNHDIVVI